MSIIVQKGRNPGQYWPVIVSDGKRSAVFYCPNCGKGMSLLEHEINARGMVNPSVVHPLNPDLACPTPSCTSFHDFLFLVGWPTAEELEAAAERSVPFYTSPNPAKEETP